MSRALRLFFVVYAVSMLGVLIGNYIIQRSELSILWAFTGCSTAWYVMLALAYVLGKRPNCAPPRLWIIAMLVLSVSCLAALISDANDHERWTFAISALLILAFLVSMAFLLREPSANSKPGRVLLPVLWAIGAATVMASVFLPITRSHSAGLEVLRLHEHWITDYFSVGNADGYTSTPWLQPIFGPVGYVFYLLTLILTVTSLVSLGKWRLSHTRMLRSPLLPLLASAVYLANFWVLVDVYWGWHFDLSQRTWPATLGAMCWLAALLFAVTVAVKTGRGEVDTALIRASLLFQFPLVLFNLLLLPAYFREDYIGITGLGCLILGLQIENYVLLAATRASMLEKSPSAESPQCTIGLEPPIHLAEGQR